MSSSQLCRVSICQQIGDSLNRGAASVDVQQGDKIARLCLERRLVLCDENNIGIFDSNLAPAVGSSGDLVVLGICSLRLIVPQFLDAVVYLSGHTTAGELLSLARTLSGNNQVRVCIFVVISSHFTITDSRFEGKCC